MGERLMHAFRDRGARLTSFLVSNKHVVNMPFILIFCLILALSLFKIFCSDSSSVSSSSPSTFRLSTLLCLLELGSFGRFKKKNC